MEGRDIGTVVFPKAFCKFFVTASLEVRSERRLEQLKEQGQSVSLEQVTEDVLKRDESDINRTSAPLKQADDAIFLDTSGLDLDEVLEHIKDKVRTKAKALGYKL
jgi:cytidylate kinase